MDCDLATWRTSQLVWEIGSQNQIESISDQHSWSQLLLRVEKDFPALKKKLVGKSALKIKTSPQNKYCFWEPISRLYFFRDPIRIFDSALPENSAFKKGEGGKNDEHELLKRKSQNHFCSKIVFGMWRRLHQMWPRQHCLLCRWGHANVPICYMYVIW